jgi:hypothetical protein
MGTMKHKIRLASALLALGDIPYEHAKSMSADQIISLYQFDHYPIRKRDGGPFMPWNLVPRLIAAHRHKTSTYDQPQIAKDRRLQAKQALHDERMAAKGQR